ncbi:MAG TPA: VOC family protein [Alphaproteobacteria bacterium]|nr:VOC family protein [Alphaproteobacteria bacterium]
MTLSPVDPSQPKVFGLHHSAYRCRDAEETRAFYEDVVGFPFVMALHIDRHPTTGEPVNYLHIFFDIGGGSEDKKNYIAFFEVTDRAEDDPDELFKTRWGMDLHFAMRVEDYAALDRWKARLAGTGLKVEGPIDHGMIRSIYFHDPNGYRLEFCCQGAAEDKVWEHELKTARQNLQKWNDWKAERAQSAAE